MENLNLKISASPHVRSKSTTSDIMFDVILALVPATVFGIYQFGWYAALLVFVCIATAVFSEYLFQKGMGRKVTISDTSAALTGLLLALNLPPNFPIWMAMLGSVFAIIVVKQLFGGLGQNFMNPALGARCFLLLAFSRYMTAFVYDGVATATPLAVLRDNGKVDISDMFLGFTSGTIGETSVVAILVGAAYLLIKRVISPKIPFIYIGTFAACIAIYAATSDYNVAEYTLAHLCGGGLMLGAWFMATDYVTSPITPVGKIIYGVILGLLTFSLRIFGSSAEGVSYAIIISNLLVPLIEKATTLKAFGEGADIKEKKPSEKVSVDKEKNHDETTEKEKSDVKGIFVAMAALFAITVVMGAALGVIYNVTKKPIEEAELKAKQEAYKEVFPDAKDIVAVDDSKYEEYNSKLDDSGYTNSHIDEINVATGDEGELGYIYVVTNGRGYGGDIQLVVGINKDGVIQGIAFLSINETAGLGMEADNPEFLNQYIGKAVDSFNVTKTAATSDDDVEAISGATITTDAVTDAINATLLMNSILTGGN